MSVFLVLIFSLDGFSEPFGVYSDVTKAQQAQEDCQAMHAINLHSGVRGAIGHLFGEEKCIIWEWELDGPRKEVDLGASAQSGDVKLPPQPLPDAPAID